MHSIEYVLNDEPKILDTDIAVVVVIYYLPTPIQTGMCLLEPKYDTKMTVPTLPIS